MSGATSGTVLATPFRQGAAIDHALRRAGRMPEQASSEDLQIARECLFTQLSEWVSAGFPLWTRQFLLFGAPIGSADVALPYGTVDAFHVYWRSLQAWRGAATTTTGASAATLVAGQPNADVTIAGPNPGVIATLGGATEVDTIGVLLGGNAPLTATLEVQTSTDGVTFTTVQTLASTTYTPGLWSYVDLNPFIVAPYIALVSPGSAAWTLNQVTFGLANASDIEIGPLNIDDYFNLPNKQFASERANSAYLDRQRDTPVIKLWPVANIEGFYNGAVTALVRRYIQDPGQLSENLEVPARGLEAVIWRLAATLIYELPDEQQPSQTSYFTLMAKQQRIQAIEQKASKAEAMFWSEERTRAPIRFAPNIRCYTA